MPKPRSRRYAWRQGKKEVGREKRKKRNRPIPSKTILEDKRTVASTRQHDERRERKAAYMSKLRLPILVRMRGMSIPEKGAHEKGSGKKKSNQGMGPGGEKK